jgi:Zn-dependent metalloprotease
MQTHACFYVPQHVLEEALRRGIREEGADLASVRRSIAVSAAVRHGRAVQARADLLPSDSQAPEDQRQRPVQGGSPVEEVTIPPAGSHGRLTYDDGNTWAYDVTDVRNEGNPAVAQENANRAYDALGATLEFYQDVLGRDSIDNQGLNLDANVNFGTGYDNAFWDGTRMVFGNGDDSIFIDFTNDVDVPGHELTHGVTQYTAGLQYTDQPGALNEATSDIMGACIDARVNGKDEGTFNWLIGEDVVGPNFFGNAIRSMKYPGSAYDGDPQPMTMSGYVVGGDPHVNSGIINRWFYLMASDLGMEAAALIWYQTLENLWPTAQFADAAAVATLQGRILARDGTVPRQAPQTIRGTAREQGII